MFIRFPDWNCHNRAIFPSFLHPNHPGLSSCCHHQALGRAEAAGKIGSRSQPPRPQFPGQTFWTGIPTNWYFLTSGILCDICIQICYDVLSGILCGILSDIRSDILSGIRHFIWQIFWLSIWHLLWHPLWPVFGSMRAPLHPLAISCDRLRVQACSTASGARDMAWVH